MKTLLTAALVAAFAMVAVPAGKAVADNHPNYRNLPVSWLVKECSKIWHQGWHDGDWINCRYAFENFRVDVEKDDNYGVFWNERMVCNVKPPPTYRFEERLGMDEFVRWGTTIASTAQTGICQSLEDPYLFVQCVVRNEIGFEQYYPCRGIPEEWKRAR